MYFLPIITCFVGFLSLKSELEESERYYNEYLENVYANGAINLNEDDELPLEI